LPFRLSGRYSITASIPAFFALHETDTNAAGIVIALIYIPTLAARAGCQTISHYPPLLPRRCIPPLCRFCIFLRLRELSRKHLDSQRLRFGQRSEFGATIAAIPQSCRLLLAPT